MREKSCFHSCSECSVGSKKQQGQEVSLASPGLAWISYSLTCFVTTRQLIRLSRDDPSPELLKKAVLCKNWTKILNWIPFGGDVVSTTDRNLACSFECKSPQVTEQQQWQSCLEFPRIRQLKFESALKLDRLLHRNQLQPHQQRFQQSRDASYATRCRRLSRKC